MQPFKWLGKVLRRKPPARRSLITPSDLESRLHPNFEMPQYIRLPFIPSDGMAELVLPVPKSWSVGPGEVAVKHELVKVEVTAHCEPAQNGLVMKMNFRNFDLRWPIRGDSHPPWFRFSQRSRSRLGVGKRL